ncbi:hypothetical protein PAXINDRAFT_96652 [Paxillus involutus ATCC 200175]|nr:hypothetical protein PAXINDRAFT_96652 [Paxillus involutus ATCC 200175]
MFLDSLVNRPYTVLEQQKAFQVRFPHPSSKPVHSPSFCSLLTCPFTCGHPEQDYILTLLWYPRPEENADVDRPPFEVSETGWGEFEIQIRVNFVAESGEKAITLYHHLKLHPWSVTFSPPGSAFSAEPDIPSPETAAKLGPVHSWQYDEIVFTDPFQSFLSLLTTHPPTPLAKTSRKPIPFHISNPTTLEETKKGGVPEFTSEMEKEEAERLEEARGKIVNEQEKWRGILIEREKELERLQKVLASKG